MHKMFMLSRISTPQLYKTLIENLKGVDLAF